MRKLAFSWNKAAKAAIVGLGVALAPAHEAEAQTRGLNHGQCPVIESDPERRIFKDGYIRALSDLEAHYGLPRTFHCAAVNSQWFWQGFNQAYRCAESRLGRGRPSQAAVANVIGFCRDQLFQILPNQRR